MASRRAALVMLLAASGCGGNPAAPAGPPGQPRLAIVGNPVVTVTRGSTVALALEERDAGGGVVTAPLASYTWISSDPSIVTVDAGLLSAGPAPGQAIVTARSASGHTAMVRVWVQAAESEPSTYRITLHFRDAVSAAWRAEFREAAARWERTVRSALPPATIAAATIHEVCGSGLPPATLAGVERGTRIFIDVSNLFTPGTEVEAVGGPCVQRPTPHPTAIYGRITLNGAIRFEDIREDRRKYLALHEMGHVLGLVGLFQRVQVDWFQVAPDFQGGIYTGPMALEGYRRRFGSTVPSFSIRGGAHWPFSGDVMGNVNLRISEVSVGALMDMGYPAAWYGAH